ncbi:MAG: class I SAM-dependent methyltransferase [SAR324 cluster bacterium]|nr:class I SAM-dependent methyltransferase [SAR324 cluster bacterium]
MAKPNSASGAAQYYRKLLPQWERAYPSTTALEDAWAFYREYGWEDPEAQLAAPLRQVGWRTQRILDFGCDTGVMLGFFARRFPDATLFGVDINAHALRQGRGLFPELNLVEFDGVELPFRDGYFDLIFASAVLKHIRYGDRPTLYSEFRRTASYLYVVDTYSERQEVIETNGFKFYHSDFRADLGATFRERYFETIGEDFLALYELD